MKDKDIYHVRFSAPQTCFVRGNIEIAANSYEEVLSVMKQTFSIHVKILSIGLNNPRTD